MNVEDSPSGEDRLGMVPDDRTTAHARALHLLCDVQSSARDTAVVEIARLRDRALVMGWTSVEILLRYAEVVDAMTRGRPEVHDLVDVLLARAQEVGSDPGQSLALSSRAEIALWRDDVASHNAAAAAAVALLDEPVARAAPEDLALALNGCGVAYHALRLWELAEECYERAARLLAVGGDAARPPRCRLRAGIAVNRCLALVEELVCLVELGDVDLARRVFAERADRVLVDPGSFDMPADWVASLTAVQLACRILGAGAPEEAVLAEARALVDRDAGDRDVGGLAALLLALAHVAVQGGDVVTARRHVDAALDRIDREGVELATRSFALWLRVRIAALSQPSPAHVEHQRYQTQLARSGWASRRALLAAAGSRIQAERLRDERDRYAAQSLLDELTGVANRRGLERHFDRLEGPATLLLVDVDGFKPVNDRFGHEIGDEVLRRLGRLLRDHVRPDDTAARLGGDEFVVMFAGADPDVALERGQELLLAVADEPWLQIAAGLDVTVSVGVATGQGGRQLYRIADAAMYDAKRRGGARVVAGSDALARQVLSGSV